MKLRSEVDIPPAEHKISLEHRVFSIGSCFADHLAHFLKTNKLQVLHNPFGNVYNPICILNIINGALGYDRDRLLDPTYMTIRDELSVSLHFHSDLNATTPRELHSNITHRLDSTAEFLKTADWLIITLGTAMGYSYRGTVIGNCHKLPQDNFEQYWVDIDSIALMFARSLDRLREFNPKVKVIFTLSPVRYFQPSLVDNSRSKSILRLIIDQVINQHSLIEYFPSYEILCDELRDYRYYKPDLVQPSEMAVRYIIDRFAEVYLDASFRQFIDILSKIHKVINHKPLNPASAQYLNLVRRTLMDIENSSYAELLTDEDRALEKIIHQHNIVY